MRTDTSAQKGRRVLFVLPDLDEPPTKGYQVRCLGIASGLSQRYVSRIVAAARHSSTMESARANERPLERLRALLYRLVDGLPLQSALFDGVDVKKRVSEIVAEWEPDAIVLVTERLPVTTASLCAHPVLVDIVDSMRLHMDERATQARFPASILWSREAGSFKRVAERINKCAVRVVASSSTALADYPQAIVIENAAANDPNPRPDPTTDVVFTGNLAYWPNVKAAIEVCEVIAPMILKALPAAQIAVAGRNPTADVQRACDTAGVSLMANVEDMPALLRSARVAVAPLSWTPAANLKVMEALAAGTPVLAYRAAARYLPEGIEGVLICEGPDEMVTAAIAILRGQKTLEVVHREQHTWAARAVEMEALLDQVLGP
jgi:glycosyltransferase involved in cell wall biosynthesis